MSRTAYILALMLCSMLCYSQQITFYENVNYRASTLLQSLNKSSDSLFLESKSEEILKVEIFNDDFSKSIDVYNNSTKIDLNTLPFGSFVIQAKVAQQWIIMYLEKTEGSEITSGNQPDDAKIASSQMKLKNTDDSVIVSVQHKTNKIPKRVDSVYYWVVTESNSNFGSNKSMRLVYKDDINRLILKHKLEVKSNIGKANKLIIYEIYNRTEFMDKQFKNPMYYKTAEASQFINTKPLYASNEEVEDDF